MKKKVIITAALLIFVAVVCVIIFLKRPMTVETVRDDPHSALSEAVMLSLADFMTFDHEGALAVLDSMTSGSVSVEVDGNKMWKKLLGEKYADMEIEASLYNDASAGKSALIFDVEFPDETVDGGFFVTDEGAVIVSEALLGDSTPYAFTGSIVREKFAGSALEELLRIPEDKKETVREAVRALCDGEYFGTREDVMKVYEALGYEVGTGSDEGRSLIIVTLYLNNESIEEVLDMAESRYSAFESLGAGAPDYIYAIRDALNKIGEIDACVHFAIERDTKKLYSATVEFDMIAETDARVVGINGEAMLRLSSSSISLDVLADVVGMETVTYGWNFQAEREMKHDKVTYTASCYSTVETESRFVRDKVLSADFEYDKEEGAFALTLYDYQSENEVSVEGELIHGKDGLTVIFDGIGIGSVRVDPDIRIVCRRDAVMPDVPDGAVEFIELDEEEIIDFINKLRGSSLIYK